MTSDPSELDVAIQQAQNEIQYCRDELKGKMDHKVGYGGYVTYGDLRIICDEISRLRSAPAHWNTKYVRADLAPTSQWRDLKDAPMDGTPVILLYADGNKVSVGWWSGGRDTGWGNHFSCHMNVIRFMPLPAPPTKDLADAGKEGV